jgi:hypothetical protein
MAHLEDECPYIHAEEAEDIERPSSACSDNPPCLVRVEELAAAVVRYRGAGAVVLGTAAKLSANTRPPRQNSQGKATACSE